MIYRPTLLAPLPAQLGGWSYDTRQLLLNRAGSWEWVYAPAHLELYDWQTGRARELNIPNLDYSTEAAQGPDSRLIAYTVFGDVFVFDDETETSRAITTGNNPAIAPDGEHLAVWRRNIIAVVNLETLAEETVYQVPDESAQFTYGMLWSPDGERLAYYNWDHVQLPGGGSVFTDTIEVVELATGQMTILATGKYFSYPSWSPDSRLLTYVDGESEQSEIVILDVNQQCEVGRLALPNVDQAYWSPDGAEIAFVYKYRELFFANVAAAFGQSYADLHCP